MKEKPRPFDVLKVMRVVKHLALLCLVWVIVAAGQSGPALLDQFEQASSSQEKGHAFVMMLTLLLFFALSLATLSFCARLRHGVNEE